MALATSSGSPRRRSGICSCTILSVPGDRMAVSISPGRDGVDADAARAEVGGHLARQRRQRGLRGGVGRAGERVHAPAGDRGDVDHRALGLLQLLDQAARQHDRGEEIDLEDVLPVLQRRLDGAEPRPARALGRDAGIVDERVQPAALRLQPLAHLADGAWRCPRGRRDRPGCGPRGPSPRGSSPGRRGASR